MKKVMIPTPNHELVELSMNEEIAAAKEAADWMLDAIAASTQDRRFLRDDPEYEVDLGDVILANAIIACLRMKTSPSNLRALGVESSAARSMPDSMLNTEARRCHDAARKWWIDAQGSPIRRPQGQLMILIVSELTEAMEGLRKDLMDDHLPQYKMEEVELADTLIRVFDYAGAFQYDLSKSCPFLAGMAVDMASKTAEDAASALWLLIRLVYQLDEGIRSRELTMETIGLRLVTLIRMIEAYAFARGYKLWPAYHAKIAYNKYRSDHKPENRAKAGGKKF